MGLRDRIGGGGGGGVLGGGGGGPVHYQMQAKLFSIGDDAWVTDEAGNRYFKVDGKALRARSTFILEDANGQEVASIQERMLRARDTMDIERGGRKIASIKKAMIAPLRERYSIDIEGTGSWEAQGNIVDHEYTITAGRGDKVAEVSKKWVRVRDTYAVEVEAGQDVGLVLAIVAAIDEMRGGA